jgi:hypothetical protein
MLFAVAKHEGYNPVFLRIHNALNKIETFCENWYQHSAPPHDLDLN